ncbi:MAG: ECF transporter S component [Acetanaerobacterium sp.]
MGGINTRASAAKRWALLCAAAALCAALVWAYAAGRVSAQLLSMSGVLLVLLLGFASFELSRPSAKTVAAVAVLSAVAVAGRVLFAPLANFKPVGAVVIVAGAVFGSGAGFMTGAASAVCSNMLFGQGAWTPWQMLGFGLVGAVAGVLGKRGLLSGRVGLCLYGAAAGYLYGIVVDTFYLLGYVAPTKEAVWAAFVGGVLFNTIHSGANVFFLAVIGRAWVKKLTRIRDR